MARRLSTWVIVAALVASLVAVARADEDVCLNYRAREVMCPADYRPVCGSDGVTYGNQCAFMAAKCNLKGALTSVDGECPDAFECPTMCDMMYSPFCGTDGQTYGNLCTLIAARCSMARDKSVDRALLSVESEGECGPAACIDSYEPVCASNGETFSNDCMLQAAARERGIVLSVLHAGICKPVNECETMCTDEIQPVCGTNGVTYSNECALNAARCTEGKEWLSVFERGSCDDLCPDMCTEMYAPVCSNTGVTFSGFCQFFQARCEARKQGLLAPTIERLGECATIECPPIDCIEVDQPVCGTDRVTYSNPCELVRASCKNADLSVCHEGRCAPKEEPRCSLRCDKKLDEVCGSDGETYRNPCLLNAEACLRHQRITIASRGPCNSIDMPVENDDEEEQDVCANVECEEGYQCVPEQRECFAPPCPQYTCARRACEPAMPVDPVPMCEQMCTMEYRPVCGSDGMIYSSLCNLESAACFRNAQGFDQLVPREHLTDCKCACFDQLFRQGWASFAGDKTSMDYFDFAAIVTAMGATPEQATSMFALMDTNGDGVLTKEEFTVYQSAETPSSGSEDDMSWYYYVVFSLGAVLGVVLLTVGFAFIFRSNKHSPTVTQPLLG